MGLVIRSDWHRLGHRTSVRGEEINTSKNDDSVKEVLGQRKLCRKSDGRAEKRQQNGSTRTKKINWMRWMG